jgi:hypothetical protein
MHRDPGSAAHAVLIAAIGLAGCGSSGSGIEIGFATRALSQDTSQVVLYIYDSTITCTEIRQTMPRPPAVLGPFAQDLKPVDRMNGVTLRQDNIPVGTYVIFVDALDGNGKNVGSGCAEGQEVLDRRLSKVQITINP